MTTAHDSFPDSGDQPARDNPLDRRRFLAAGFWTSTGLMGVTLLGAGGRFWVGDALAPVGEQWVQVDEISNLPTGAVHKSVYRVREKDAWRRVERQGVLYVFSDNGVDFTVLNGLCTHMGCNVHWQADKATFRCPCHDGYFDQTGAVISGPPVEPLAALQTKIEDGVLFALV